MKRSIFSLFLILALVVVFTGQGYAKTYKWRIQSAFSRGDFSADLLPSFAEEVKKKSNGQLILTPYYAGDLVPTEDTLTATTRGIMEMSQGCGALWQGVEPILGLVAGAPFMYKGTFCLLYTSDAADDRT